MYIENNLKILKHLEKYTLPKELTSVLSLLYSHLERICFVKDHNGVENLLFISTLENNNSVFPHPHYLLHRQVKSKKNNKKELSAIYSLHRIKETLVEFFSTEKELLFVSIGFIENKVTNEDYMNILSLMEASKCNPIDAHLSYRRFPTWYEENAELPIYIYKELNYFKDLEDKEKEFVLNLKEKLLNDLYMVVEKNDESLFYVITEQLRTINKQLNLN